MDYIGSKEKLNNWIFKTLESCIPKDEWKNLTFLDACAGIGTTSKFAIESGFKKVISNDIMKFSHPLVTGYVSVSKDNKESIKKHIENINKLNGREGFFYKNYSESVGRLYFTNENAKKIDDAREYIRKCVKDKREKNFLLYCSLEAMTRVLNTTGVQAAFLKKFKQRAKTNFKLRLERYYSYPRSVEVYSQDIIDLLSLDKKEDILYIDPPYNERQYGPNYHLYETFVRNDNPVIRGKTGLREWEKESKSKFCSKKTCLSFLKKIIELSHAKIVLISYSSDGLLESEKIENLLLTFNNEIEKICIKKQTRYNSDSSREYSKKKLKEYLYILRKEKNDFINFFPET